MEEYTNECIRDKESISGKCICTDGCVCGKCVGSKNVGIDTSKNLGVGTDINGEKGINVEDKINDNTTTNTNINTLGNFINNNQTGKDQIAIIKNHDNQKITHDISFLEFASILEQISATTKRLEIQSILAQFLSSVAAHSPHSLAPALFLCTGSFYPQHFNAELGVGDLALLSTVATATGLSIKNIQQKLVATGDLGTIAMAHRVSQLSFCPARPTVTSVLSQLRRIAAENGKNAVAAKKNAMLKLISDCSPLETKYAVRLFGGKLKVGLALQTVLISLALALHNKESGNGEEDSPADPQPAKRAKTTAESTSVETVPDTPHTIHVLDNEAAIKIIKEAYNKQPDFEILASTALQHGLAALKSEIKITPGIPLKPMLAQPCKSLAQAYARVENIEFVAEYKYDGERIQIHHGDGKVSVFSRNSEDIRLKYPDICASPLSSKSYVIDGEVVAYADGAIQPFQLLSTRKRKAGDDSAVPVCVFAFDILYYDGRDLLEAPLAERRELLRSQFKEISGRFHFADSVICKSIEDIDAQFKNATASSCEGVMLKSLASSYRPSLRTNSWVKIKSDYLEALGDSLDLVAMGAFFGKGKRTGTYGGFLLGVYNEDADKFEACCKIGTGFSEALLQSLYDVLAPTLSTDTSEYIYKQGIEPDVWLAPRYVWEVKAASLSLSPIYSAGSWPGKGISLRFPRFIRVRDDKPPREATTSTQILRMYVDNANAQAAQSDDDFN